MEKRSNPVRYLLRLSRAHAAAVSFALEVAHRLAMGQVRIAMEMYEGKNAYWQWQRDQGLEQACDYLQRILFPDLSPGGGYGYGSERTGTTGQLIYEVKTCLDYRRAWAERPPDPNDVLTAVRDHYEPSLFPSPEPNKPQCATEDGSQPELAKTPYRMAREIEQELGTRDIKEALAIIRDLKRKKGLPVMNDTTTIGKIQEQITTVAADTAKAEAGNKSAATRARVGATAATKLLKQLREELLALTK